MGRERRAVTVELGLPIEFPISMFVEHSILALGFQDACIGSYSPTIGHGLLRKGMDFRRWSDCHEHGFGPIDPKSINEVFNLPGEVLSGDRIISSSSADNLVAR